VSHPQRKTIGLRVPEHKVLQELLALHGAPLLATTLIPPGRDRAAERRARDPRALRTRWPAVIDAGACPSRAHHRDRPHRGEPEVVRQGRGDLGPWAWKNPV
jgi:tRNA A37 threonylcarbamoyladenosine synthetase subunit TsaC/SUA5/YrdC